MWRKKITNREIEAATEAKKIGAPLVIRIDAAAVGDRAAIAPPS